MPPIGGGFNPSSATPTGPAGGDLGGTYPNPTVPVLTDKADKMAAPAQTYVVASNAAGNPIETAITLAATARAAARSANLPYLTLTTDQVVVFATGSIACGQFTWNASNWEYGTYGTYVFAATMWISGATPGIGCTVQLYNVTDGEAVTLGVLTTTSNTPIYGTVNLACGAGAGLLKTSAKMYEVRITLTGGADPTDTAYVGSCRLQQSVV